MRFSINLNIFGKWQGEEVLVDEGDLEEEGGIGEEVLEDGASGGGVLG